MRSAVIACLMLMIADASSASAQLDVSAQRLRPVADATSGFIVTQRGRTAGDLAANVSIAFNYARDPLVLESTADADPGYEPVNGRLLTDQSALHLTAVIGPTAWLELGVDVPIVLHQSGERLAGLPDPNAISSDGGIGQLRLVPRAMLVDTRSPTTSYPIALSVGFDAGLPTGAGSRLQGGQAELYPMVAIELMTPDDLRFVGNAGYVFRPDGSELLGVRVESAPAWSVGVSAPIAKPLRVAAEVAQNLSTEALFSALLSIDRLLVSAGAGVGLISDELTPDFRIFARAGYAISTSSSMTWRDKDNDAVPDWQDECPTQNEDHDGFADNDGCPDSVRDYIESTEPPP